ncbi:MAG TPA: ISNCY family transposase [Nonomuraea sp.]|nr:ISNCY family transposase [Nonomuraea sp.]
MVLFGLVLPNPEALMDPPLRVIDEKLGDDEIVETVVAVMRRRFQHSARRGRPGTPAEVVLRMLVLKHLRGWSYDDLEREVQGSLVYRRFCRIDAGKVPDAKTMVRLGQLVDGPALRELLQRLVAIALEAGVTKGNRMRVDTTVVEAPIHHPTDSGLCEDAVRVLSRIMRRMAEAGVRLGFKLRNVRRSVSRRMREIAQGLRRRGDRAKRAIKRPYRRLLRITGRIVRQAERAAERAGEQLGRLRGRARRRVAKLVQEVGLIAPRTRQVLRQTRARVLRGETRTPGKIVSIFEPWTQVIRKGKPDRPTEFGVVVKVQEAEGGIVTDIAVDDARADAPLLVPSVEQHKKAFGRAPRLVAADRGFYSHRGERRLRDLGVHHPVLPKPGHRTRQRIEYERQRWFQRGRAWRAGGEARISRLKNTFGMKRSRYRGRGGIDRTIGWAAIANNLAAVGRHAARRPAVARAR